MVLHSTFKNLFENCNSFPQLQEMLDFLWYFDGNSPVIIFSLFSKRKLCVIVSEVPFQLVKIANGFSFLNALLSGGLKSFYGSILVSLR